MSRSHELGYDPDCQQLLAKLTGVNSVELVSNSFGPVTFDSSTSLPPKIRFATERVSFRLRAFAGLVLSFGMSLNMHRSKLQWLGLLLIAVFVGLCTHVTFAVGPDSQPSATAKYVEQGKPASVPENK